MNPVREPLSATVHFQENGMPIKSKLAEKFPLLTRRERRAILRKAKKIAPVLAREGKHE